MNKHLIGFAITASLMNILLLGLINYFTNPAILWFIYPSIFILLWPISQFFIQRKKYLVHALICSLLLISFVIASYLRSESEHPWFLYVIYPILWWPITLLYGKRAGTIPFAILVSSLTILYYAILNFTLSSHYLWIIYPTYVILWWPLSLYFAKKRDYVGFSLAGSLISILFFIGANLISSPQTIWAIYPIFLILWWPLSMYFFVYLKKKIHKRSAQKQRKKDMESMSK